MEMTFAEVMAGNGINAETILMKVFGPYYSSYLLDVENDLIQAVKPSSAISGLLGEGTSSWSSELAEVIVELADPHYHESLHNFLRLEHIAVAFKESQAPKEILFKKRDGAWRRAFAVPIEVDGGFTRRALLLINSDFAKNEDDIRLAEEVISEAEQAVQQEKEKLATILKYMYLDYGSMYEIDVPNDYYKTLFLSPGVRTPLPMEGCYSETNLHGVDGYAKPEYVEERIKIGELEYLKKRLKEEIRVEYEFETLVPFDPWKRVTFQAIESEPDGTPIKIIMANSAMDFRRANELQKMLMKNGNDVVGGSDHKE